MITDGLKMWNKYARRGIYQLVARKMGSSWTARMNSMKNSDIKKNFIRAVILNGSGHLLT